MTNRWRRFDWYRLVSISFPIIDFHRLETPGQVGNSRTRATGYILCLDRTGSELFYQFRPQGFQKMADDRTGRVRDVCFRLICQSIAIDELFLCGYRLIID